MKPKHYSRKFLNKDEGTSLIELKVSTGIGGSWVDADVNISDCNRTISLDFGFSSENKKNKKEKLDKLNLIIEELQKMKKVIEELK